MITKDQLFNFDSPYMNLVVPAVKGTDSLIPAVIHLENTGRVQTEERPKSGIISDIR